jgi:hypothetical protein
MSSEATITSSPHELLEKWPIGSAKDRVNWLNACKGIRTHLGDLQLIAKLPVIYGHDKMTLQGTLSIKTLNQDARMLLRQTTLHISF